MGESHLDTAAGLPQTLLDCSMKGSRITPHCSILMGSLAYLHRLLYHLILSLTPFKHVPFLTVSFHSFSLNSQPSTKHIFFLSIIYLKHPIASPSIRLQQKGGWPVMVVVVVAEVGGGGRQKKQRRPWWLLSHINFYEMMMETEITHGFTSCIFR